MTTVKHSPTCTMSFGRKDPKCPRCVELLAGAPPRRWHGTDRKADEARQIREVNDHFASAKHRTGGCGPVCTFGEW